MNKLTLTLTAVLLSFFASGQSQSELEKIADGIVSKAKLIYELEKAAWIANDTFLAQLGSDIRAVDSYVSYKTVDNTVCVFYTETDSVLAEFIFQGDTLIQSIYEKRPCTQVELRLIKIKRTVEEKIANKEIKKFKVEPNTKYNFVAVVLNDINYCYLINAVSDNTKTILGRDWKIELDSNFNIVTATCNHKTIQELPFNVTGVKAFYHTHVLDDYFSETEIATCMLYKNLLPTDQFMVMSEKYTSVWNNTTLTLTIK